MSRIVHLSATALRALYDADDAAVSAQRAGAIVGQRFAGALLAFVGRMLPLVELRGILLVVRSDRADAVAPGHGGWVRLAAGEAPDVDRLKAKAGKPDDSATASRKPKRRRGT